jgi:hypothetical protein
VCSTGWHDRNGVPRQSAGIELESDGPVIGSIEKEYHFGMRIDKLPIKGRVGLAVTLGVVVIFLISLPEARWFLALSVGLGAIIAVILRLTRRD